MRLICSLPPGESIWATTFKRGDLLTPQPCNGGSAGYLTQCGETAWVFVSGRTFTSSCFPQMREDLLTPSSLVGFRQLFPAASARAAPPQISTDRTLG